MGVQSTSDAPPRQAPSETRHYAIAARVRPVLFWIGKESVGEARLTWLAGPNGERGYEFLIGSDPARAPRNINQWGFVREVEQQGSVHVLGLVTESDEKEKASFEDAQRASRTSGRGGQLYRAIRSTVGDGTATSDVQHVTLAERLTFRDVETAVAQVPGPRAGSTVVLPAGTFPGFLFAITSLLHESVATSVRTGVAPVGGLRRSYFFGRKVYIITTLSSKLLDRTTIRGREYRRVIGSEFEARSATEPKGETFRVWYGTEAPLREVPIKIVYRPNFWFEAEIALVDAGDEGGR